MAQNRAASQAYCRCKNCRCGIQAGGSKEDTMGSLMAKSTGLAEKRSAEFLGYFNPFSYIIKETPSDEADRKGTLSGKNIVSVFGVPLFTTDTSR